MNEPVPTTTTEAAALDCGAVARELRAGRATSAWMDGWLPATWRAPARFTHALYRHALARTAAPIRSRPDSGFDLYGDCISSKLGEPRAALVCIESGRTREASVAWLHARCSTLASAWRNAGVSAGERLAIVLPVGVDYALALLCGLRLGLQVSVVPPLGADYVHTRIRRVAPDHVVTTELFSQLLPADAPVPLSPHASGGDATFASSHSYAADEVALQLLSPFGDAEAPPFALCAGELHAALLRDSLLCLGLQPGDRLALPGFDPVQWQPLALLCTLMAGATFVELDPRELSASPGVLQRAGVTVLGIDHTVREVVLARGADLVFGVRCWFRSLSDTFDYVRWQELERLLGARDQLGFTLLYNAASGGAHLFSAPTQALQPAELWPAPGRSFAITRPGADLLPSIDQTGLYTPLREDEPDASLVRMVIAKLEHGWTLGGSIDPGPQARALPALEIARSARRHPRVREACLVLMPGRFTNDGHSILVTFDADPDAAATGAPASDEILRLIRRDLGAINTPERVDNFALHPRFVDGQLDRDWCTSQYLSGALTRKARAPLFTTLARLSWIFEPVERADP